MGIVVRPAVPGDAPGLVATHVRSWQAAYQPFFSPDYLASLSEETESRIERWERIIASPDEEGSTTFVAVEDGRLTGFLGAGPARDEDVTEDAGEIYACYVDPSAWRKGTGSALMDRGTKYLRECGFVSAVLWVFEGNEMSRRFYEQHRWAPTSARHLFERAGCSIPEIRYRLDLEDRSLSGSGERDQLAEVVAPAVLDPIGHEDDATW